MNFDTFTPQRVLTLRHDRRLLGRSRGKRARHPGPMHSACQHLLELNCYRVPGWYFLPAGYLFRLIPLFCYRFPFTAVSLQIAEIAVLQIQDTKEHYGGLLCKQHQQFR